MNLAIKNMLPPFAWKALETIAWKVLVISVSLALWEAIARYKNLPMVLPTVNATFSALFHILTNAGDESVHPSLLETVKTLTVGFIFSTIAATVLTGLSLMNRFFEEYIGTHQAILSVLPAVIVFPIAQLVYGITWESVVFICSFAGTFPMLVNMRQGVLSVNKTIRQVGQNLGMSKLQLALFILLPAALPSIISGFRNSLSNALRALMACELVIGAATGAGGLGFFIIMQSNNLEIATVYAAIVLTALVGLTFEAVFATTSRLTVRKWGMERSHRNDE